MTNNASPVEALLNNRANEVVCLENIIDEQNKKKQILEEIHREEQQHKDKIIAQLEKCNSRQSEDIKQLLQYKEKYFHSRFEAKRTKECELFEKCNNMMTQVHYSTVICC
jgi:CRISPR/Cas system CMR subunit Cmr6 (Cas7 group RAMP superfamily)